MHTKLPKNSIKSNFLEIHSSLFGYLAITLAAIKKGKNKGALILGICNVVGSSISRLTDAGIYTHAGPEIGVASTKAFTAQVTVLIISSTRTITYKTNASRHLR